MRGLGQCLPVARSRRALLRAGRLAQKIAKQSRRNVAPNSNVISQHIVAFGSIHSRDTHETEARLTRHIIQMIDDLEHRSKIVWALITTRPDLLDPDFVRSGRCSVFVPIFDPEGEDNGDSGSSTHRWA